MSMFGELLREKGWTLAGIIIAGIVIFLLIDFIHSIICYGISTLFNATYIAIDTARNVADIDIKTDTFAVGNYTASIASINADREGLTFIGKAYTMATWLSKQIVSLATRKELFIAIIILSLAIAVYENMVGEE